MGTYLKMLRNSENPELKKAAEDLINKWKVILHKPSKQNKPNKPTIKSKIIFQKARMPQKKEIISEKIYIYISNKI